MDLSDFNENFSSAVREIEADPPELFIEYSVWDSGYIGADAYAADAEEAIAAFAEII